MSKRKIREDSSSEEESDDSFFNQKDSFSEEEIDEDEDDIFTTKKLELEFSDESEEGSFDEDEVKAALSIEKKSKKLDERAAKIAQENQEELTRSIKTDTKSEKFVLPSGETIDEKNLNKESMEEIHQRIDEILRVLNNFKEERDPERSRAEYLQQLENDLATFYGYNNFLINLFLKLLPVNEIVDFLDANEVSRPMTIRTNTLKTRRKDLATALISKGVNLEPIKWSKLGLQIYDSTVPVGATPEYLSGYYMLQSAASFLPVLALDPKENEKILDMCAAPGGKSTNIAQIMKNTGVLVVNDVNSARLKSSTANIHRLGVKNTIITNYNGCEFPRVMGKFDRVICDAPCAGLGVITRDPSVKLTKSEVDIQKLSQLQKKLVLAAIDSVNANSKTGGIIVYCTCSLSVEENEAVVAYALKKRSVKLESTNLPFGVEGFVNYRHHRFHPSLKLTRRYYAHKHNLDGFFVAKFKKYSNFLPTDLKQKSLSGESDKKRKLQQEKKETEEKSPKKTKLSEKNKKTNKNKQNQIKKTKSTEKIEQKEIKKTNKVSPKKKSANKNSKKKQKTK